MNAATQARDEAIDRVGEHANPTWKAKALAVVARLSRNCGEFTTDDVWEALALIGESTHEPRALGAIMQAARKQGICFPTETYIPSARTACHARPVRVWRANN